MVLVVPVVPLVPVVAVAALPLLGAVVALLWPERPAVRVGANISAEDGLQVAPAVTEPRRQSRVAATVTPLVVQDASETATVLVDRLGRPPAGGWTGTQTRDVVVCSDPDALNGLWTLVTVGRLGDDDVLVDCVGVGVLGLTGDPIAARATLRRMWAELRWPAEEGHVEVIGVGNLDEFPGALGQHDWSTALARLEAAATTEVPDATPLIVLAANLPTTRAEGSRLATFARAGRGAGVVVVGPWSGSWSLKHSADTLRLDPIGLDVLPLAQPEPARRVPSPDPADQTRPAAEAGVEVSVLGPVEVRGVHLGPKETELVTYLALHPEGATEDQLRTALWPDRVAPRGTFNNVVSLTRRHLGTDAAGEPLLPRRHGGRYRLRPSVSCDLLSVERALDAARDAATPGHALDTLAEALTGVRGRPFDGWTGPEWPFEQAFVARAEATVAAAAHRLVDLALAAGRPELARIAVARGLQAVADPLLEDDLRRLPAAAATGSSPRQLRLEEG